MTVRGSRGASARLAWATALTTWLVLWSWSGFAQGGGGHIFGLLPGMAAVTAVGMLSRLARFPAIVVLASQLLTVMLVGNLLWGGQLFPTPTSIEEAVRTFGDAVNSAQEWAAPVPATAPSVSPLIIFGGLLVLVLVDLFAVTLARVPAAGLPLLAAYSLPVSLLDGGVNWLVFALGASGFLLMLALQEDDRVTRWGRAVVTDEDVERSGFSVRANRSHPAALGASAIAAALVLPLVVPTLDIAPFGGGDDGPGNGHSGQVTLRNPITDMRRDLVQGDDDPAVRVVTTDPSPSYLRIAVLTTLTSEEWRTGERNLSSEAAEGTNLPPPVGLGASVPRTVTDWSLELEGDFGSDWLPTPMYLANIDLPDGWGVDPLTLDFHVVNDLAETKGTEYSLSALDVDITPDMLVRSTIAPLSLRTRYTALPDDLSPVVQELARQVTAGEPSAYERAVALQRWFRTQFTYSLDRNPGNGGDALEEFLSPDGRVGYCEQFASAMATMARTLGIPARVAVGFLSASPVEGEADTWEFSLRDMHAWPELYFEGVGWVRFEPTPSARAETVPSWTRGLGAGVEPTSGATHRPEQVPNNQPTGNAPTARPEPEPSANAGGGGGSSLLVWILVGAAGLLVALALLALVPRGLRRRRTTSRWAAATIPAEAAWAELRDSVVDLGLPWPAGRSPRAAAERIAASFAAPLTADAPVRPARGPETNPEATAALDDIVFALEQSWYAPPGPVIGTVDEMRAAAEKCIDALRAGVSPSVRRRAEWLPASLRRLDGAVGPTTRLRARQGVVDSLR